MTTAEMLGHLADVDRELQDLYTLWMRALGLTPVAEPMTLRKLRDVIKTIQVSRRTELADAVR